MPQGPDYAVKDQVELALVEWEHVIEVVLHQSLQEDEEIGSDFRERVKICGDER